MSSTASRPADAISAAPTFSYAQAAKGRAASSTTSAIQSSQATSGVSTPAKDSVSAAHTPSASVNGAAGSDSGDRTVNGNHDVVSKVDPLGVGIAMEPRSKPLTNSGSLPDSPSFGTASTSTLPKEEEVTLAAGGLEGNWRNHQSSPGTETNEGRRGKKGKKQRNTEKEPEKEKEEVKQEVLVAAPPPMVNIWQQRKEAAAAKASPSPSVPQSSQAFNIASTNDSVSGQSIKTAEMKRRGKSGEEADNSQIATQSGNYKDVSASAKGQKKGSDGMIKAKDDNTKRTAPRGSRGTEKDDSPQINQLPPPVEDAISWPTPETALEEDKRKAQEKPEKEGKDESVSNKSRPKEKWMHVPFVPSVNFATPIPGRGARGRGGGRGGRDANGRGSHSSNAGATQEKAGQSSTSTAGAAGDVETRGRGDSSGGRAASLPPNSSKRPASDTRERKQPASSTVEKPKPQAGTAAKGEFSPSAMPSQAAEAGESHQNQQGVRGDDSKKTDQSQGSPNESNPKAGSADRREPAVRGSEQFRDGGSFSKDNGQARERADGQSNRGRGNFRGGRGNNHNYPNAQNPQQTFANGHAAQPTNGFPPRHNSNPYSSPIQQAPFPNQFMPNPSRGGRGGSRSQSIPNTAMFPRFPGQPMQPLQTNHAMFDYQNMQPMSATPYNPFNMESYSVLAMVTMQLEYYFSIDNLCKDVYLRKHMDSQGFVFLAFIAGFKRLQALTQDIELLRYACQECRIIDAIQGEDGVDRLRRKEGWEKWVLAMEERDESVRYPGPKYHHRQQPRSHPMGQMVLPGNQAMSPPPYSPNGTESGFPPFPNEASVAPTLNGTGYHPETPLSAAVPDFAPGVPRLNGLSDSLEEENFSDEDVAALMIVITASKSNAPFHSSSSRTFSNGSIDSAQIIEDSRDNQRQGRTLANGTHASET